MQMLLLFFIVQHMPFDLCLSMLNLRSYELDLASEARIIMDASIIFF